MATLARKKTIVLCIFTLQGGGAERFVLTLAEAFRDLNHTVHVICFKSQHDYERPKGINYHNINYQPFRTLPKGFLRYWLFARVFDRYIKKRIGQPDLMLSNLYEVDSILHHSHLKNIVYVLHSVTSAEYNLEKHPLKAKKLKQLYRNHPLVAVSEGVATDYRQHIDHHANLRAIYNPINQRQIIEKSLLFLPELPPCYIVHVGKFKPQKDHETLLKAYAKSGSPLPLVLVGTGPLQKICQALAKTLNISDRVIFTGFQENPYPYIKHATAMVLSSRCEGFGIVIGEALALDVPVISTDCPSGPRELLPPNNLVALGNVEKLAQKIFEASTAPEKYRVRFDTALLPERIAQKYLAISE